jgi:hypothetical protein
MAEKKAMQEKALTRLNEILEEYNLAKSINSRDSSFIAIYIKLYYLMQEDQGPGNIKALEAYGALIEEMGGLGALQADPISGNSDVITKLLSQFKPHRSLDYNLKVIEILKGSPTPWALHKLLELFMELSDSSPVDPEEQQNQAKLMLKILEALHGIFEKLRPAGETPPWDESALLSDLLNGPRHHLAKENVPEPTSDTKLTALLGVLQAKAEFGPGYAATVQLAVSPKDAARMASAVDDPAAAKRIIPHLNDAMENGSFTTAAEAAATLKLLASRLPKDDPDAQKVSKALLDDNIVRPAAPSEDMPQKTNSLIGRTLKWILAIVGILVTGFWGIRSILSHLRNKAA